jgi:hypothetical protein
MMIPRVISPADKSQMQKDKFLIFLFMNRNALLKNFVVYPAKFLSDSIYEINKSSTYPRGGIL